MNIKVYEKLEELVKSMVDIYKIYEINMTAMVYPVPGSDHEYYLFLAENVIDENIKSTFKINYYSDYSPEAINLFSGVEMTRMKWRAERNVIKERIVDLYGKAGYEEYLDDEIDTEISHGYSKEELRQKVYSLIAKRAAEMAAEHLAPAQNYVKIINKNADNYLAITTD